MTIPDTDYDDFQNKIKERSYKIGWYIVGLPKEKHYFEQTFESWHEASSFQASLFKAFGNPNMVLFIEPITKAS